MSGSRRFQTDEEAQAFLRDAQEALAQLAGALGKARVPCDRLTAGALIALCVSGYQGDRENFVTTGVALYRDSVEHARTHGPSRVTKGGDA